MNEKKKPLPGGNYYRDTHRYDDMLDLPHPVSQKHSPMPLLDRAAQFAPFAALTGHEKTIRETEELALRQVEQEIERLAEPERVTEEEQDRVREP